jgi:uncharacterized membrane protein
MAVDLRIDEKLLAERLGAGAERLAAFLARHWLLVTNSMMFVFVAPPFLAPCLAAMGAELPARLIYILYSPTCHQLPERSLFLFGHQMAFCARCTALYLAFWVVGLLYGLWGLLPFGQRYRRAPLRLRWLLILSLPMIVDGLGQLLGLYTSTNFWRLVTGALAGGSFGFVVYPGLAVGFSQVRRNSKARSDDLGRYYPRSSGTKREL